MAATTPSSRLPNPSRILGYTGPARPAHPRPAHAARASLTILAQPTRPPPQPAHPDLTFTKGRHDRLFSPHHADGRADGASLRGKPKRPYGYAMSIKEVGHLLDTGDRARIHRAVERCNKVLDRESVPNPRQHPRHRIPHLQPGEYTPKHSTSSRKPAAKCPMQST